MGVPGTWQTSSELYQVSPASQAGVAPLEHFRVVKLYVPPAGAGRAASKVVALPAYPLLHEASRLASGPAGAAAGGPPLGHLRLGSMMRGGTEQTLIGGPGGGGGAAVRQAADEAAKS
jgi:hypothetical protein